MARKENGKKEMASLIHYHQKRKEIFSWVSKLQMSPILLQSTRAGISVVAAATPISSIKCCTQSGEEGEGVGMS